MTLEDRIEAIVREAERRSGDESEVVRRLVLEVSRLGCDLRGDLLELRSALEDDIRALTRAHAVVSEDLTEDALRFGIRSGSLRSPALEDRFSLRWRELQSLARVLELSAS